MAFNTAAAPASSNNNDSWKAQAFINVYLPSKSGTRIKVGTLPLKESKGREAELIAWLKQDEENLAKLVNRLEFDFRLAADSEANGFDLG